ncbi:MAG TPA: hypothetical protein VHX88_05405 [Solirubrobacteraceae bacterium]|nr:hypothetical protein [Solirubrobacteraceae bacterium]
MQPRARTTDSSRCGGEVQGPPISGQDGMVALQRAAGNAAAARVAAQHARVGIAVQRRKRAGEDGRPTISERALENVKQMLTDLQGHRAALQDLAASPGDLTDLAFTYGLLEIGPNDSGRTQPIPAPHSAEHQALLTLGRTVSGSDDLRRALDGEFDEDDLDTRLGPLAAVFVAAANLWVEWESVYSRNELGRFEFKAERDVVAHAVGDIGDLLRHLTRASKNGTAITKADVDNLYAAYNDTAWEYHPQLSPPPHDMLLGHSDIAVCGAFAGLLVEMVSLVAKCRGVANPATKKSHLGVFVTIPYAWGYIDPAVKGNIESIEESRLLRRPRVRQGGPNGYDEVNRAVFTGHTWMEAFGHTYDPLGKKADVDFMDHDIGPLTRSDENGILAANKHWKVVKVTSTPPKGLPQGYKLVKK